MRWAISVEVSGNAERKPDGVETQKKAQSHKERMEAEKDRINKNGG